jgi:hypothetical protein
MDRGGGSCEQMSVLNDADDRCDRRRIEWDNWDSRSADLNCSSRRRQMDVDRFQNTKQLQKSIALVEFVVLEA